MKQKIIILLCLIVIGYFAWRVWALAKGSSENFPTVNAMDPETGEKFKMVLSKDFAGWPTKSPKTGKMTVYPVEMCFWNQCKNLGGTWVILNEYLGIEGSTKCPVCGKKVVGHNPIPPDMNSNSENPITQPGNENTSASERESEE